MKATTVKKVFLLLLTVIILVPILNSLNFTDENRSFINNDQGIYSTKAVSPNKKPKLSADPFELTQEFTPSTYYISPVSSPGVKDDVFFSFEVSRNGNYTIEIQNTPMPLTENDNDESYTSFDNPTSTNLYYLSFMERGIYPDFGNDLKIKLLKSEDKGKNWKEETIASYQGGHYLQGNYLLGTAIAANPSKGVIGIITYFNQSELVYFGSEDNGTTWSDPKTIANVSTIGCESLIISESEYPNIELGILPNGTIYALTETASNSYTDIVYFKSNDNGTTWSLPKNITCLEGLESYKPKLQVDLESGDHWLAYKVDGADINVSWAEFNLTHSLSASVTPKSIEEIGNDNYDFYYDGNAGIFRLIVLNSTDVSNYTTDSFLTNEWTRTSFYESELQAWAPTDDEGEILNIAHDGDFYQFFYSSKRDIIQYIHFENSIFWRKKGNFTEDEFMQIKWDGEFTYPILFNMTMVKVSFVAHQKPTGPEPIARTRFLKIDNIRPLYELFDQNLNYFNPMASNISFSEILWDILPSEPCYVNLEVFAENSFISDSLQVTNNFWNEREQKIFLSNTGQLFVLYVTQRASIYCVNLIRSLDYGITWSEPIEIYQAGNRPRFCGAAWGDYVVVLISESLGGDEFLYKSYRSYDQGRTWLDPIDFPSNFSSPRDITFYYDRILDKLGLYVATRNFSSDFDYYNYSVYESTDFGVIWNLTGSWLETTNFTSKICFDPKFGLDANNDYLTVMMSAANNTEDPQYQLLNVTVSILNSSSWMPIRSTPLVQIALSEYYEDNPPNILLTSHPQNGDMYIRIIYPYDYYKMELNASYSEVASESWSSPYKSSILYGTYTSVFDYETIYYLDQISDGFDSELVFIRDGRLVKSKKALITPNNIMEFTFDGIDDFGNYIDEGKYTYTLSLVDPADNRIEVNGWFYADYKAPQITGHTTNLNVPPTPRYNTEVSVKITDINNFTAYLYYRKDGGNWQKVEMINTTIDDFSATIPGDTQTLKTEYYIKAIDIAGNEFILDDNGDYFICDMPTYIWDSEGLFKETKSYSSSTSYDLTVTILNDLEYVREVIFRYSYDEGDEWDDLELEQSSPEFEGELDDIPEDLKELYYKIVIVDIFGIETEVTETQKVEFYPEVPSLELNPTGMGIAGLISATMGILLAIGYIKLKKTSHETIQKQMFYKKYKKTHEDVDKTFIKKDIAPDVEGAKEFKIAAEFTYTYLGILFSTIALLIVGSLISGILSLMAIYLIAGSLIMAVFGYMILMSRDIKLNIYKEEINKKNFIFEGIQVALMFIIIMMMLLVGNTIPWFRYYLIESTFDIGTASIPTLYLSMIVVFFTSLVLVIFSTYLQLRKIVGTIKKQRKQGESENFLLFTKDQSSSKLISQLALKTIAFLVAVLLSIVTTTNLITYDTGIVLIVVIIPFIIACASILLLHYVIVKQKAKTQKKDIEVPFVDKEKICIKCGKSTFQSDKFCGACGAQLILPEKLGTYVARCTKCDALINDKAKHCPTCGSRV